MKIKIANTVFKINNAKEKILNVVKDFITEESFETEIDLPENDEQTSLEVLEKRSYLSKKVTDYLFNEKNVVRVHGSAVCFNDSAIIFMAPSGTGKSTHANLWEKYASATIINDDQPYLDINSYEVFGSCWAGKHNKYSLNTARLKAFVILKRATTNSIKQLDKMQAVKLLYKQIIQYGNLSERVKLLECMEKFATEVPFYLLECNVSKDAFLTCF